MLSQELPARYYSRLCQLLDTMGIDTDALLLRCGIRRAELDQAEAMIPLGKVDQFTVEALRLSRRSDLGFELGSRLRASSHSIVGYGILSSPTLDYAARLLARFFRLITPTFRMRYERDARRVSIIFEPVLPLSRDAFCVHLEAVAVGMHSILHELLSDRLPKHELYLSIPAPAHAARYGELAATRCHFRWQHGAGLQYVLPAEVFDLPPALADSAALGLAERQCLSLLEDAVADGRVSDWVRMMLREASDGLPSLSDLAHTLNLSTRTLDRHLRREGSGFRALIGEVMHARACHRLAHTRIAVTSIAIELGYTDAANFTRAFRRHTGMSPSQYRQACAEPRSAA